MMDADIQTLTQGKCDHINKVEEEEEEEESRQFIKTLRTPVMTVWLYGVCTSYRSHTIDTQVWL